jgi:hypothetical protein
MKAKYLNLRRIENMTPEGVITSFLFAETVLTKR